ncbi:hypothetical protein ACFWU5_10730 [Nocardia sp. NPDC058640]|uniref:hypothetical protein n=1 Tax=Nocardia sp. NPDC058640 TaxID=3346571 RepID=UPI00365B4359
MPQSIIRQSAQNLKAGNLLVVGRRADTGVIVAAAHLTFDESLPTMFVAHIAAIGVCTSARGQGGKVADRALGETCAAVSVRASECGAESVQVTANIHIQNYPSQLLFERAAFEPFSLPRGEYQKWIRILP